MRASVLATLAALAGNSLAHLAAWHPSMWCYDGNEQGKVDANTYTIVNPLYNMAKKDWWFHGVDRCDQFPPQAGQFLELPAGGSFQMEIAGNRGKTSWSFNGRYASEFTDGAHYNFAPDHKECIEIPNIHTENQGRAAGTAFAIAYVSELSEVTPENLAVFSVRYHTPWERITNYDVPKALPACPPGGCICAWGWVPRGCGIANMYMNGYRCKVTGATSTAPVLPAKPPVWCEGDPSKCTKGARQMLYWNQAEGSNIWVDGYDLQGEHKSPGYNMNTGFVDGAQNEIFGNSPANDVGKAPTPPPVAPAPSPSPNQGSNDNSNSGNGTNSGSKTETLSSAPLPAVPAPSPAALSYVAPAAPSYVAPAPAPAAPSPEVQPAPDSSPARSDTSSSSVASSTPASCPTRSRKRRAAERRALVEAAVKRSSHRRHANSHF